MAQPAQILILDIDSSSVGACILEQAEQPILSHVQRIPIGAGVIKEPAALLPLLKESLTTLVPEYVKRYPKLTRVAIVLASPWFAASVKTLTSKAEKPVRVSKKSVQHMLDDFQAKNPVGAGHKLLEALPITVEVNGYRTRVLNPVHGTGLSITFYESYADSSLVSLVEDVIHTSLAGAKVMWHSTPIAYAETLLRLTDEDHATVLDVGGEVTDITILSHQCIAYVGSIPIGSHSVARSVAGGSATGIADTMSRLSMFARAELSEKEMQAMSTVLTSAGTEWQNQYRSVLDQAGNSVPLSHRVFIIGEREELPWIEQIVQSTESRGQRPVTTVANHEFLSGFVAFGDGGMFDSSLVLDALFFHMHVQKPEASKFGEPVLYSIQ